MFTPSDPVKAAQQLSDERWLAHNLAHQPSEHLTFRPFEDLATAIQAARSCVGYEIVVSVR
jgi:hypothetical protein